MPTLKESHLKYLTLSAGLLGLVLRATLYATGIDEKGLLVRGHWAGIGIWLLTALVFGAVFLISRSVSQTENRSRTAFSRACASAGCIVATMAFLLSPAAGGDSAGRLHIFLRLAAAGSLVIVGYCRFLDRKPPFLLHGVLCVYFALRTISLYRMWSADPQLQDYCFYLGAHLALMLASYRFAAFDAGMGDNRTFRMAGPLALYLCLTAIPASGEAFFLLGCAIWIFTNLNQPQPATTAPEERC